MHAALNTLSPQRREAVELVHFKNFAFVDAAEQTGCSPDTFRKRYYRAIRELAVSLPDPASQA